MERIAIVFDNRPRKETTGIYCRRALGHLMSEGAGVSDLEHFLPDELADVPSGRFDLFLFIDDGLPYVIPPNCRPAAWWAIDTHLEWDRSLENARRADWTFAAQRDGAERLRQSGIANAQWLPLACDPELHGRQEVPKEFDVGFIGNVFPGPRQYLLDLLRERFPSTLIDRQYFQDMARAYSSSRVVFNRSIANDVNMRVFEALCSGSLLVTNELNDNGLADLLADGRELATYSSPEHLIERVEYFLENEREREEIARRGRAAVLERHTYRHRMETVLRRVRTQAPFARPQGQPTSDSQPVPGYFQFERPDVLELIPENARKVLDIGCGAGRLGASIKRRQSAEVTGIELDPQVAEAARTRLDTVVCGSAEDEAIEFPAGQFDCVVCADVLEHLRNPEKVLLRIHRWLTPGGVLVTSLPNVRNHTVIRSLLAGNWTYEPAGLLDQDHVRFFTRREIEKLLWRSGFDVDALRMTPGEGFEEWVQNGRSTRVTVGGLQIEAGSQQNAAEFFAYQYLTRSTPRSKPNRGLTSIVLVTHNQLDYTRLCIDSVRLRTDEPYEWIFVDNASTDGTVEYLRDLNVGAVISNSENRGFPAGVNQGLAVAKGDQILLLNNDTIVTTGWLARMLDALDSGPDVGLVGPVSNRVSGEQQIPVDYGHLNEIDGFGWDWSRDQRGQWRQTDRLVGFCLLFRRSVLDAIGGLDEQFGIGNFEDDDFCLRAQKAGFRALIAVDSFVHHFGGTTFRASGVDFAALMTENQRRFEEKWSDGAAPRPGGQKAGTNSQWPLPPPGKPRPKFLVRKGEEPGLLLEPNTVRLSVCLIVRDNESTIRPCLESIRPWVDEMVVVDTGSKDSTPRICEELGARVFHWAWRDDFSAARNVSVDYARGEWIFWMDSDDTIPEECGRRLRELADGSHPDGVLGYVMQVHCPGPGAHGADDVTAVDHVKLIRNLPDLRFEHRIHEQILPSIRRAGGEVAFTDIYVIHSGSDHSPTGRERKLDRDFRLLDLDLKERPDHPFVLFNLGMTCADAGQHTKAVKWLRRCLSVSQPLESHVRKTYAILVSALAQLGELVEAKAECLRGRELYPEDKELLFRQAMLEHQLGNLEEAVKIYRSALAPATERHFASVDLGITGFKARHNLALVYEQLEQFSAAEHEWRTILAERPDYIPAAVGLIDNLLRRSARPEAKAAIATWLSHPDAAVEQSRMSARVEELANHPEDAVAMLKAGIERHGDEPGLLRDLARLLYGLNEFAEAAAVLGRLTNAAPDDASAWHNRGVVLQALQRETDAQECLTNAILLRTSKDRTIALPRDE